MNIDTSILPVQIMTSIAAIIMTAIVCDLDGVIKELWQNERKFNLITALRILGTCIFSLVPGAVVFIMFLPTKNATWPEPQPQPETQPEPDPQPVTPPSPTETVHYSVDSSVLWIILAIAVVFIALTVFLKTLYQSRTRREEKRERQKLFDSYVSRIAEAQVLLRDICASYAQAFVDPEVVLYKPLVISDAPQAQQFLKDMTATREQCDKDFKDYKDLNPRRLTDEKIASIEDTINAIDELNTQWVELNNTALDVGTPLLDSAQIRRAERLWAVATNESATVAERRRAMDKLDDIIAETKEYLSKADTKQHTKTKQNAKWLDKIIKPKDSQENNTADAANTDNTANTTSTTYVLLDAINAVLTQGRNNNIIAPPHRVAQLGIQGAPLMLTAK